MNRRRTVAAAAALALIGISGCSQAGPQPAAGPDHDASPAPSASLEVTPELAVKLAMARAATADYVADLDAARGAGYQIITKMMPGMGFHYLNPKIQGFEITKPAILVYVRNGDDWQLGALEWVWPVHPATDPLDGATYGSFAAACHFQDGTFVPAAAEADCAQKSPDGSSPFAFWHPTLVTMHVWLWYHNPDGLFNPTNPLIQ